MSEIRAQEPRFVPRAAPGLRARQIIGISKAKQRFSGTLDRGLHRARKPRIVITRSRMAPGRAQDLRMAIGGRTGSGRFKRVLQTVHLWLGLLLAIPIIVIGLSGSALLLQREILAYSVPAPTADGQQATLEDLVAAAQKAAPENATVRSIVPPAYAGAPTTINFDMSGRQPRTLVHVDPVSGEVLGTEPVTNRGPILDFLIQAHAFLLLPAPIGFPMVGWMAVVMTFMAVSGLVLWWPRKGMWRHAFWVRKGARGLRFHVEFHHVVGFWGSVDPARNGRERALSRLPRDVPEDRSNRVLPTDRTSSSEDAQYAPGPSPLHADGAIAAALAAVPNTRAVNVQLPPHARSAVRRAPGDDGIPAEVAADPGHAERAHRRDQFHRRSEAILDQRQVPEPPAHAPFRHRLGWVWKVLVFVSGILPLALGITGLMI